MNTNLINKIAKKITAGGGAGINFSINEMSGSVFFTIKGTPEKYSMVNQSNDLFIHSFNARGYDDGMDNVDGKIIFRSIDLDDLYANCLNIIEKQVEDNKDDTEFVQNLAEGIQNEVNFIRSDDTMIYGGYVRGTLKQGDVINFNVGFQLTNDWDTEEFDTNIAAQISQEGEYWYQDVFQYVYENDQDIDIHYRDNEINYGV